MKKNYEKTFCDICMKPYDPYSRKTDISNYFELIKIDHINRKGNKVTAFDFCKSCHIKVKKMFSGAGEENEPKHKN